MSFLFSLFLLLTKHILFTVRLLLSFHGSFADLYSIFCLLKEG